MSVVAPTSVGASARATMRPRAGGRARASSSSSSSNSSSRVRMGTDRRDARGDGGVRARARTRASVARFGSVRRARGDVRARSESAAASDGDDGDASAGASCDLEFMKMVRDDADKPTTGYALQVAIFGSCVVAAVMLFVAFDLGSSTFMMDAKSRIVGALAKSGFTAAFALIFVSELGDKTFFIAALLAMRLGRLRVLAGATTALASMTVISVAIGRAFQNLPSSLAPTLPIGEYAAVAMLMFFGVKTLKDALAMDPSGATPEEHGELAEATEVVCKSTSAQKRSPGVAALIETFTLIFIAEWGDRSMLATIALGAAQNPVGVAFGATLGHFIATLIAVVGGSLLSKRISERTVGVVGGSLFLAFALFTALGVF